MISKVELPPLPIVWGSAINDAGDGHINLYGAEQMRDYALAAYAAGRDAGIGEAAKVPRQCAERLDALGWGNRFPNELAAIFNASTDMANNIRALISDARGAGS